VARVVVLSGAGISAESGIPTFRDSGGLWNNFKVNEVCQVGCLEKNRENTIAFYDKRREDLKDKLPNKAHKVLAKLKKKYPFKISIITQNVDDLFEKAGLNSDEVIHLHGELTKVQCEKCGLIYDIGYKKMKNAFNGKCPTCNSEKIRPFIVMFGEIAPNYKKLNEELLNCELLVVIGTSGEVLDVSRMARKAKKSILNNLKPSSSINEFAFTKVIYDKATVAIDEIKEDIIKVVNTKDEQLTEKIYKKILEFLKYDMFGLSFDEEDKKEIYELILKIIKEQQPTNNEFNQIFTNLILKFKFLRDNEIKDWENKKEYNKFLSFLIEFDYDEVFKENK